MLISVTLVALAATVTAGRPSFNLTQTNPAVPNVYIVKLSNTSAISDSSIVPRGEDAHSMFHKRASFAYEVRTEFTNPKLFYGLTIKMTGGLSPAEAEEKLRATANVEAVWPVRVVHAPKPVNPFGDVTKNSSTSSKASTRGTVDTSTFQKVTGNFDVNSALKMSGVDKLHAMGIKGKGIKIGIIDTGVDYRHPALGGGFGPGFKVEGGYAYVDDEWYGPDMRDPIESSDPLATCFDGGHGTHVTGIIGAQDPEDFGFGLTGVAPEATIYMYRVFSCLGVTTEEMLLRAMQRAVDDGVHIVSMSWGGVNLFEQEDSFSSMISGFVNVGIAPIVAAGNDGQAGVYYTSSPATSRDAIAVGSISNTKFPITYTGTDSRGRDFKYASIWPITTTRPLDVYILTVNSTWSCGSYAYYDAFSQDIDWSTTVLAIYGSQCYTGYWSYYNFTYVAFINDIVPSSLYASVYHIDPLSDEAPDQEFLFINGGDSATVMSMYEKAGGYGKYKWNFGQTKASSVKQDLTGGRMSNFSTFGPTMDTIELKPQLSAPGGNILGTWPLGSSLGGYTIISGTSMATPFVAAAYALVKSQLPDLSVSQIRALLQTTSTPVGTVEDHNLLSTVVHQGGGLINPYAAITYESSIFPGELAINDTDTYLDSPSKITITNKSTRSKTYTISHQGAGYVEHFPYPDLDPNVWYWFGQPQLPIYSSVSFSSTTIQLSPGQSTSFSITFTPPPLTSAHTANQNPVISGFIKIQNNNDIFTVPYAGLPYSRYNVEYFTPSTFRTVNPSWPAITLDEGFLEWNFTNYDVPLVEYTLNFYAPKLRSDILAANTTFVADFDGPSKLDGWTYQPSANGTLGSEFLGEKTYGVVSSYTGAVLGSYEVSWWIPYVYSDAGNWDWVGEGDYRILTSVLKFGGDASKRGDWITYLGPVVRWVGAAQCLGPTQMGCYPPDGPPGS